MLLTCGGCGYGRGLLVCGRGLAVVVVVFLVFLVAGWCISSDVGLD